MIYGQTMAPITVGQGLLIRGNIDWSVTGIGVANSSIFDFQTQPNQNRIKFVRGMWVDNSANANDVTINVLGSAQFLRVYAGEVVTMPIFTPPYPQIIVTNVGVTGSNPTNAGLTILEFCDFDLGFTVTQAGGVGGGNAPVKESNLDTLFGSTGSGGTVRPSNLNIGWTQSGTVGVGGATFLYGAGSGFSAPQSWWWVQNQSSSAGNLLVGFTSLVAGFTPTVNNSILVPNNGLLTWEQVFGVSGNRQTMWIGAIGGSCNWTAQGSQ